MKPDTLVAKKPLHPRLVPVLYVQCVESESCYLKQTGTSIVVYLQYMLIHCVTELGTFYLGGSGSMLRHTQKWYAHYSTKKILKNFLRFYIVLSKKFLKHNVIQKELIKFNVPVLKCISLKCFPSLTDEPEKDRILKCQPAEQLNSSHTSMLSSLFSRIC